MKVAVFSTKNYDKEFLTKANARYGHQLMFLEPRLTVETAKLAFGFDAVCVFVGDHLDKDVLSLLANNGVRVVVLRCAGFNNVDLVAAEALGLKVLRVPAYSPHGVAEHAVALILALNRKIIRANNRVHEGNFALEGLMGSELFGSTVGIIGTGKIGVCMARIMKGFGCHVIGYDEHANADCLAIGVQYVTKEELYKKADIISLHLPLMPTTHHMINAQAVKQMKTGVMLINTSRGGLIDTSAVIAGLKSGKIGYLGLDVYEEESLFFQDFSGQVLQDDVFARLLTFSNVIVTGHQAFFTSNALVNIAETTLKNVRDFEQGNPEPMNVVAIQKVKL